MLGFRAAFRTSSRVTRVTAVSQQCRTFQGNASDAASAVAFARNKSSEVVNLKFTDMHGTLQQLTLGMNEFDEDFLQNGLYFDGSSIRGWQPIHESDMMLVPDPSTICMDPFTKHWTATMLCSVHNPGDRSPYSRCPRHVAQKCVSYLKESGMDGIDHARVGPEIEFFVFDAVRYKHGAHNEGSYQVDSVEGNWNMGDGGHNLGYKLRAKEGYFPAPPFDTLNDLRVDMCLEMDKLGLHVEASHHEVASGGQCEIDFRFDKLVESADKVQFAKYIIRNVAMRNNRTATFMPKPLYRDNGSGMHQHYSLHAPDGTNLFVGDGPGGLSEMGLHFIGGIIRHSGAICAFTNPTTNSYKRLVPGFEAPIFCTFSSRNRSAFVRIPLSHPRGRRAEFRTPDCSCNPYLAFPAVIMAGMDGIRNKIDPGPPMDMDLYELNELEAANIKKVPPTLMHALEELHKDREFLKEGDVFTDDLIDMWISRKEAENRNFLAQPTPFEFHHYYDC